MDNKNPSFWAGFYKKASLMSQLGAARGRFSRGSTPTGGFVHAAKANPLPTQGMHPAKMVYGRGVGSTPVP